ncbi:diguanylate cyclase domain-containing protein [Trichlorobacter lovleyi]|uniref:diguanylate cyclase domain-containing protein n=1 Tax=Trichlorobacter lovleyi TaxID=313985 RepID=UPI0024800070|nr:diguanylate cyclase [Trichlorobacter lovleyi]
MNSFYESYQACLHRWDVVLLPLTLLVCSALLAVMLWYLHARRRLCMSEEHFRNLAEASFEGIILSRNGGTICDSNERASEMSGFSRQELLERSLYCLIAPEYHTLVHRAIADGFDGPYEIEGVRADGSRYLLEVRGKTFQSGGHTMRASTLRDVTARRAKEAQLRKLSAAVEHSPASIVITNRDGAIEYVNPAFSRLTGYSMQEALGQNPRILKAGDQPEEFYRELWAVLLRGEEWRGEFHNKRKDGSLFWEMASISPILNNKGEIISFVAVKENITERKELRDRLEQMAQFDMLTGLPNRRMFLDRLSQTVAIAQRTEQRFALLFVDLDGFKRINDSYGHEAGDRVLKTVAARLAACIRMSDTVGRMGGDEFTIILSTLAHYEDAGQVADKILDALSRPITLPDGQQDTVGSSIGISVFPEDAQDGDGLLATADDAMYKVKRNGKNSYCFYHSCKPVAVVQETI